MKAIFSKISITIVFVCLFIVTCKKKEIAPGQDVTKTDTTINTDTLGKAPETLYGTWKREDELEYWEFSKDVPGFYRLTAPDIHVKENIFAKIGARIIKNEQLPPWEYHIEHDSMWISGPGLVNQLFRKADNNLINSKTWQKQVKVLKVIPTPWDFLPYSPFGFAGDTIFYQSNHYRVISYDVEKNRYYDSFKYEINSMRVDPPYFYYYSSYDNWIYRTIGFNKNFEKWDSIPKDGKCFSMDNKTKVSYFIGHICMLTKPQGGMMQLLKGWSEYEEIMVHYLDNEFLILKRGNLCRFRYEGEKLLHVETYDVIPGYDYIESLATNGIETWVSVRYTSTGNYRLVKLDLN
jgi:hypothetical protein